MKASNLELEPEFPRNVSGELSESSSRFEGVLREERLSESQVTPRLTLVTNASGGNQSLHVTVELLPVIISPIMSCFKESPIVFAGVAAVDPSFYFESLFDSAKPFESGLLRTQKSNILKTNSALFPQFRMSRRFDSFSVARSPYNGRGRELSRGVVAARRAAQVLTDKGRRNEGEKKKERPVFAEVRTAYKHKTERSLLVDEVNKVGLPLKGKKD